MEINKAISILIITFIFSFYLSFVIRLIRNNNINVFSTAFSLCLKLFFTPFFIPIFLNHLRKTSKLKKYIKDIIKEILDKENKLTKEDYDNVYKQVEDYLINPKFFIKTSFILIMNYLRNWDTYVDAFINELPKKNLFHNNPDFMLTETLTALDKVSVIFEVIRRLFNSNLNNVFHLKFIK